MPNKLLEYLRDEIGIINGGVIPSGSITEYELECPPVLQWTLAKPNKLIEETITDVVNNYQGQVSWITTMVNEKHLLLPQQVYELMKKEGGGHLSRKALDWFMENKPEFGKQANSELAVLSSNIVIKLKEIK